eukprot:GFUD01062106.1.p1 GENE.GFUD01062106.1~~GFUD01062106.1.p1  ORF type:complete len:176 (+),score=54.09 GFUD01062106.1:70-528(+)
METYIVETDRENTSTYFDNSDSNHKTISVEDLLKEEFELLKQELESLEDEQLEVNTEYVVTRNTSTQEENPQSEMELWNQILSTSDVQENLEDGSGDNSFDLFSVPENTEDRSGEDVFKALLDLILPSGSDVNSSEDQDLSLEELIKHIGSQ